ncbi:MAG: nuclear transport factor 2 family protein [Lysobacteraceae bacterium]
MQSDIEALARRNQEIVIAENTGDMAQLGGLIASQLVFLRRDGSLANRDAFLQTPRPGHRELRVESIQIFGARAMVACTVTDSGVVTHNLRLFVREQGEWKLLGWANEPA